ncbi:hypothetical protein CDEST_14885 [Colletotrichum destructivum]|uniref:Uncharacterized protein n=1 Tax=Colletotrichum destructivum TaxID=34406 RepID=A0AAX4J3A8_9PEZI|nr:hypothetical protein CDEST_14885 [Colletotrichum destructivum]
MSDHRVSSPGNPGPKVSRRICDFVDKRMTRARSRATWFNSQVPPFADKEAGEGFEWVWDRWLRPSTPGVPTSWIGG